MTRTNRKIVLSELRAPWDANGNVIWLASTLRLVRNLEKFTFPQKLSIEKKQQILSVTSKIFLSNDQLSDPQLLKAEEVNATQREFLIEHFLLSEGFQESYLGAAFGFDATGEVLALFNIKDHLQLQCTDCSGDLEKSWERLIQLEETFQKSINFAFLPKFGFLTSDPMHCGTAFFLSAFLHLPALIITDTLLETIEKEKGEGIQFVGFQGNPDEFLGDIIVLRNSYTLGVNEETILSTLRNAILRFVIAEKDARGTIKEQKKDGFKDRVAKAVGLMKYSYKLEPLEALNAISMLKLGLELGWVQGMSIKEVNRLFFDCRRIHLTYLFNEPAPSEEIAIKRAEYLKKASEKLSLHLYPA